jgi:valyl-tRNA synthetase
MIVARTEPDSCPECGGKKLVRDPDTLDTWFSSALWPFSTLGWPEQTKELGYFFPTNVLVTGYDIIFFWVARMIFSSLEQMGEKPFSHVLIHGLVRDANGEKMSKSKGNGIDPLEIIDQYGADALRLTLAIGNSPGNDMRFSDEKVRSSRNFCNKIWNASRFILMNLSEDGLSHELPENLTTPDRWLLSQYNRLVREVTDNLEKFELGIAVGKLYDFIWDVFCDWFIELCKPRLSAGGDEADAAKRVLVWVWTRTLALLHPFMPFITEEIWQTLPHEGESLMITAWPQPSPALEFADEEARFGMVMDAIKAIRAARANANVPPSKKSRVFVRSAHWDDAFVQATAFMERLAFASEVLPVGDAYANRDALQVVTNDAHIWLPLDELVDREKELARLGAEQASCEKEIAQLEGRLANEAFVTRAPAHVVDAERQKLQKAQERLEKIQESLAVLKK